MGAFAVVLLIANALKKNSRRKIADLWRGTEWKKVLCVLFSLFLYALVLPKLGYLIATFGLMAVSMRVMGGTRLWIQALSAVVIAWSSYLVFCTLLGVVLPKGVLGI
jgi:hypothetical protein